MLPTASPSSPALERASAPASADVSLPGAARTVSVMELETGCRLLLVLHRGRMQGRAYTLFAPASHEFCRAHALTPGDRPERPRRVGATKAVSCLRPRRGARATAAP